MLVNLFLIVGVGWFYYEVVMRIFVFSIVFVIVFFFDFVGCVIVFLFVLLMYIFVVDVFWLDCLSWGVGSVDLVIVYICGCVVWLDD